MPVAWNWDHRFTAALAIVSDEHAQGVITRLRNTMTEVDMRRAWRSTVGPIQPFNT